MIKFLVFCKRAYSYSPSAWVFVAFFVFTLLVYKSTLFGIPRSDHVAVFSIFQKLSFPEDISEIAFMEFFGHPRFQPLAWLLHFFEIKVFGSNFLLYHLVVIALHALNGMLVFKLINSLTQKKLLSILAALVFVSLFTHLSMIAWPLVFYSLISVSLSLLALLSLLRFHRDSQIVFLYLAYAFPFVALFLYELNLMVPAVIFALSLVLGWSTSKRRGLVLKNLSFVAVVYLIYGSLYLTLMPRYAGIPENVITSQNLLTAFAAAPIEFFNTVFGHNAFATSQIVIDELVFAVPFTAKSFSLTTMDVSLVKLNFLVYLALLALVLLARRPYKGRAIWIWLLAAWAFSYVMMVFLGRSVPYVISQMRHAYLPAIAVIVILAFFYERHFSHGLSVIKNRGASFQKRYGAAVVIAVCLFFTGLNTAKVSWALDEYMRYRDYPNAIYYAADDWLSEQENKDNSLFISVTTYPPHEKLAWGADIVSDLFLDDPRITKNFQEATHILEWREGEPAPSIIESAYSPVEELNDDFTITFGMMTHPKVNEDFLEIFGSLEEPRLESPGRRWWVRLYFEQSSNLEIWEAGRARVVLGYSEAPHSYVADGWVFKSQPVSIGQTRMTHFVLVRENDSFGLIVNGELVEKAPDISGVDLRDMELPLGKLYRMGYRKPYYAAHTFIEFGRSSYSIQDKDIGYVFENIRFNPMGFQEYHLTLEL